MTRQEGFTLLEMLAALAVLAMCGGVLLAAFAESTRALGQSSKSDMLEQAARSLMDDLTAKQLVVGQREGQWDGMQWEAKIIEVPSPPGSVQLFKIELMVRSKGSQADFSTVRAQIRGAIQ